MEEVLFEDVMENSLTDKDMLTDGCSSEGSTCSSLGFRSICQEIEVTEKTSFKDFEFDFLRASYKYTEDIWLYIYYNVMSERHQMYAAERL